MERKELITRLTCPLNWDDICPEPELRYWLRFGWYTVARRHQIDCEVEFLFCYDDCAVSPNAIEDMDDAEVVITLHNVRRWHDSARVEYLKYYNRIYELGAVRADTYSKHYVAQRLTAKAISDISISRRASVLLPHITPDIQNHLLWAALDNLVWLQTCDFGQVDSFFEPEATEKVLRELFDSHSLLVNVDFCCPIGATNGLETQFGRMDIDFSTPQFHLYPITYREYTEAKYKCRVQGWNFDLSK